MLNKNGLVVRATRVTGITKATRVLATLLLSALLSITVVNADGLEDYVLTKLDGKGTVDSINLSAKNIVINDRVYALSSNTTVFDVKHRKNSSLDDIEQGDNVGFKSMPLSKPTAPYDQMITKFWILPNNS